MLSVEINKVLGLQICWYGDLNNMTRGEWRMKWTDPLARVGSPVVSILPQLATPSTEHGALRPTVLR